LAQHRVDEGRFPMVDVCHDGDVSKIRAQIHVRIIPVWWADHENERTSGELHHLKPSELVGLKQEEVLPQQAPLQAMPGGGSKVRKAELHGIRGKHLTTVYKRARRGG
jgi:hypothetical protein